MVVRSLVWRAWGSDDDMWRAYGVFQTLMRLTGMSIVQDPGRREVERRWWFLTNVGIAAKFDLDPETGVGCGDPNTSLSRCFPFFGAIQRIQRNYCKSL